MKRKMSTSYSSLLLRRRFQYRDAINRVSGNCPENLPLTLFPCCATLLLGKMWKAILSLYQCFLYASANNFIIFWRMNQCQLLLLCMRTSKLKCLRAILFAIQPWRMTYPFIAGCGNLPTVMATGCAEPTVSSSLHQAILTRSRLWKNSGCAMISRKPPIYACRARFRSLAMSS